MKIQRLKQFSVSMMVVLSLFVSSVAACCCSHHQVKAEAEVPSCHQQSHENENKADTKEAVRKTAVDVPCECYVQAPSKVFAKSETAKIQKDSVQAAVVALNEINLVATAISRERPDFSPPSYLSDSFYNLSPGRAPPRL